MFLGIFFVTGVSFYLLKFLYRNEKLDNPDPPELAELKREIYIWQRTKNSIHPAVRDLGVWPCRFRIGLPPLIVPPLSPLSQTSEAEEIAIKNLDAKIRQLQAMCNENRFDS